LIVIPGKLALLARPAMQRFAQLNGALWMAVFTGM
jgi:hypothetical protein